MRVDHERELGVGGHHDSVLDGVVVRRQALELPVRNGGFFDEEPYNVQIVGHWNLELFALVEEVFDSDEDLERRIIEVVKGYRV